MHKIIGGAFVVWLLTAIALAYGWVMNIIFLFNLPSGFEWSGSIIFRIIGVFIMPLGGVLGYF